MAREFAPDEPVVSKREFAPDVLPEPTKTKEKPPLPSMFGAFFGGSSPVEPVAEAKGGAAAFRGLSSSILGIPGSIPAMVNPARTEAESVQDATPENIRKLYTKLGWEEPKTKELQAAQFAGEITPLVVAGGSLAKSLGLGAYDFGKTFAKKTYGRLSGKEAAALAKEAEKLGYKVKVQTSANVAERAASERKAEQEASAKAKELESLKNRELQSQTDISQAKAAVSQKLIAEKTKAAKNTSNAMTKLSNKVITEEEIGGLIQPLGRNNIKQLSKVRQETAITKIKNPAFDSARSRESGGEYMATNPESQPILESAFDVLKTQIERTTEPYRSQLRARLQSLQGEQIPLTQAELRVEKLREASIPGYVARTSKQQPMSLDQAEFLRRMVLDKEMSEATGFAAIDIARRNDFGKILTNAMKKFEPRVGEYLTKYQQTSAPITKALTGRGGQLTEAQQLAEEEILFSSDKSSTAKYYLDGSQERAQRLVDLVGSKPKALVDSIAGLVRGKMEKMSAQQAEDYTKQGLFNVFPEIKESAIQVTKAKQTEEKVASLLKKQGAIGATGPTGRLGEALRTQTNLEKTLVQSAKQATTTAEKAKEAAIKFETFGTHLNTLSGEDSLVQSKNFLKKMAEDNLIPQSAYQKSLQEIQQAENAFQKFKDADTLKKNLRRALTYKVLATTVGGGTAYYFTH